MLKLSSFKLSLISTFTPDLEDPISSKRQLFLSWVNDIDQNVCSVRISNCS